jgi:hypothetical protein
MRIGGSVLKRPPAAESSLLVLLRNPVNGQPSVRGGGHEGAPVRHCLPALHRPDWCIVGEKAGPRSCKYVKARSFRTRAKAMHLIETLGRLVEDLGHLP